MTNQIEKQIDLHAPIETVWRALTDHREFGEWFRVKLDSPFVSGKSCSGRITYAGYEHLKWEVQVVDMRKPDYFSFKWHPYAIDPDIDYAKEEPTLVEFKLEQTSSGTRLTVLETGFDALPKHRQPEAMRMNEGGWTQQVKNIKAHVEG